MGSIKAFAKAGIVVILCSLASSCEMIKSWFDVEFATTLIGELNVDIQEPAIQSTSDYTFYSLAQINPLDDEQIAEYKDNIREIEVTRITAAPIK